MGVTIICEVIIIIYNIGTIKMFYLLEIPYTHKKCEYSRITRPGKRVGSIRFGFDPCGFGSNEFGSKNGSS
jgi:hypothetical protein